jgi:hypothetical protein
MLISPAPIDVPESVLADLRERLARTRWFDAIPGTGWSLGTDVDYLRELAEYWRREFRWDDTQRRLNALGPIATEIDGQRIHALHVRLGRVGLATPEICLGQPLGQVVVLARRVVGGRAPAVARGAAPFARRTRRGTRTSYAIFDADFFFFFGSRFFLVFEI